MGTDDDKRRLREVLRRRRAGIAAADRVTGSAAIIAGILADPHWARARAVAAFVGTDEEPDTSPLLRAALADGKTLWLPRVIDGRGGRSELVRVSDLSLLQPASFGLREPAHTPDDVVTPAVLPSLAIDLVLVPGLAFARDGARIGHGPGHYDRLLAPVRDHRPPLRVGVAFAAMIEPANGTIPLEQHDVPMHAISTERGLVECA